VISRKLAILTGLYVGVVVTAQVSANKIIELPFTHLATPAGTYLIGLALALIETAHHTAPTRREGWKNAQIMIAMGFVGSAVLAVWIAIVNEMNGVGPDRFGFLAGTWRIVVGSLAAFAVSETLDNGLGAWMRGRVADPVRVMTTNVISVPLDSLVFLAIAFGSLAFIEGQIVAKLAATVVLGIPSVLILRHFVGGADRTMVREA
jgi:queuosine precursor transporter